MKFIEEVVVDAFLPTLRSMLAEDLRDRGLTQTEVADLLGISQSAVSKYAHGEVERHPAVLTDDRVRDLVERVGAGLASGEMSRVQALVEAEVTIRALERGDLLATLHEDAMPALAEYDGDFSVHDADSDVRDAERALASVRRGLRTLENASGFAALIPAVGSNLVECLPDGDRIDDVVAVPGRIVDIKGRATVPADPEFGASEHVARVLLAAREASAETPNAAPGTPDGARPRAALNVRYTDGVLADLETMGLSTAEFDPQADLEHDDRDLAAAIADAFADGPADVLYQTGGFGIEPVIYVLGPDAATVAERVRDLV